MLLRSENSFAIVDSGQGTAVLAQALSAPPGGSSPSPLGPGIMGVRVQGRGLLTGTGLRAPQDRVGRRHVEALAGVVGVPAVRGAAGRLLQGVEGVQGVGVLGGVEIEPELVRVLPPGVHHHRHIGLRQSLFMVLLPRPGQGTAWSLHLFA